MKQPIYLQDAPLADGSLYTGSATVRRGCYVPNGEGMLTTETYRVISHFCRGKAQGPTCRSTEAGITAGFLCGSTFKGWCALVTGSSFQFGIMHNNRLRVDVTYLLERLIDEMLTPFTLSDSANGPQLPCPIFQFVEGRGFFGTVGADLWRGLFFLPDERVLAVITADPTLNGLELAIEFTADYRIRQGLYRGGQLLVEMTCEEFVEALGTNNPMFQHPNEAYPLSFLTQRNKQRYQIVDIRFAQNEERKEQCFVVVANPVVADAPTDSSDCPVGPETQYFVVPATNYWRQRLGRLNPEERPSWVPDFGRYCLDFMPIVYHGNRLQAVMRHRAFDLLEG